MVSNTKLVREFICQYPNKPNRELAKLLFDKYPKLWGTVEAVRTSIRRIRGVSGKDKRNKITDKSLFITEIVENTFGIPKSDAVELRPYILTGSKALILSDIHIPYHDVNALNTALKYAKAQKVDAIVLAGDVLDGYTLSKFEQNKLMRDFAGELSCGKVFLQSLRKHFPHAKIVYREGNHDYRFERYLMREAPALIGVDEFDIKVLLRTFDHGVDYVKDKRIVKFGKLNIMHGDEFGGNAGGVNPARSMFLKALDCTLSGHNHRTSNHTEMSLDGKQISNWSIGCMCHLKPSYMPYNKWNHGFAIVELHDQDNYTVYNHCIINGKIY